MEAPSTDTSGSGFSMLEGMKMTTQAGEKISEQKRLENELINHFISGKKEDSTTPSQEDVERFYKLLNSNQINQEIENEYLNGKCRPGEKYEEYIDENGQKVKEKVFDSSGFTIYSQFSKHPDLINIYKAAVHDYERINTPQLMNFMDKYPNPNAFDEMKRDLYAEAYQYDKRYNIAGNIEVFKQLVYGEQYECQKIFQNLRERAKEYADSQPNPNQNFDPYSNTFNIPNQQSNKNEQSKNGAEKREFLKDPEIAVVTQSANEKLEEFAKNNKPLFATSLGKQTITAEKMNQIIGQFNDIFNNKEMSYADQIELVKSTVKDNPHIQQYLDGIIRQVVNAPNATTDKLANALFDQAKNPGHPNEDTKLILEKQKIIAMFDGAGGSINGAGASQVCANVAESFFTLHEFKEEEWPVGPYDKPGDTPIKKYLRYAADFIQSAIQNKIADDPSLKGSYTTELITKLSKDNKRLDYINIGDSQLWRIRKDGTVEQISTDQGYGNGIANSFGTNGDGYGTYDKNMTEVGSIDIEEGDVIIVCSDGIMGDWDYQKIDPKIISEIVATSSSAEEISRRLIAASKKYDDTSIITLKF